MKKRIVKLEGENKRNFWSTSMVLFLILSVLSCTQQKEKSMYHDQDVLGDSESAFEGEKHDYQDVVSSGVAVSVKGRKLIKTVALKFEVNDVFNATQEIESLAFKSNGFIVFSELSSTIDYRSNIRVSQDSSVTIDYCTHVSTLKLRVPTDSLNTFLKSMSHLITYLDYRNIQADDVTLSILRGELIQTRSAQYETNLRPKVNSGNKLKSVAEAENEMYSKQKQSDLALISNLELEDQIKLSTITMDIYQPQSKNIHKVKKDKIGIKQYQTPFITLLWESILSGWIGLQTFILFIVSIWEVILVLFLLGMVGFRFYKKNR